MRDQRPVTRDPCVTSKANDQGSIENEQDEDRTKPKFIKTKEWEKIPILSKKPPRESFNAKTLVFCVKTTGF